MLNIDNIQSLIDSGEGYNVEFKVRVPSKVRELKNKQKKKKTNCHSRFNQRNISCAPL